MAWEPELGDGTNMGAAGGGSSEFVTVHNSVLPGWCMILGAGAAATLRRLKDCLITMRRMRKIVHEAQVGRLEALHDLQLKLQLKLQQQQQQQQQYDDIISVSTDSQDSVYGLGLGYGDRGRRDRNMCEDREDHEDHGRFTRWHSSHDASDGDGEGEGEGEREGEGEGDVFDFEDPVNLEAAEAFERYTQMDAGYQIAVRNCDSFLLTQVYPAQAAVNALVDDARRRDAHDDHHNYTFHCNL